MEGLLRRGLLRLLTGERQVRLTGQAPSLPQLREEFERIDGFGLYLHIPFCERICPYCPYNKELYRAEAAEAYLVAVKREIDLYAGVAAGRPVTSLYIGGGTPTAMLRSGLGDIVDHLRRRFDLRCDIHMESHPDHLTAGNLDIIAEMGVRHLSVGIESLVDRHLRRLRRSYTADQARESLERALSRGFSCVNADMMFALPGQTEEEVARTGSELVRLGADQVAAYPLFLFPHTPMGRDAPRDRILQRTLERRRMLRLLETVFYEAGYERTSVWAFTKRDVPRYCSVTVPLYLGLGAGAGSYLRNVFYLNTFGVADYVRTLDEGRLPIALAVELTERMQRAGWLYWRIYETRFRKADYRERFGEELDAAFGSYLRRAERLGMLTDDGEQITLSDRGAFWLHAGEDLLSIDYIGKLWGASRREAWPERAILS